MGGFLSRKVDKNNTKYYTKPVKVYTRKKYSNCTTMTSLEEQNDNKKNLQSIKYTGVILK